MGADSFLCVERAAEWAGIGLSDESTTSLTVYHDWLIAEASKAGGIGPNETNRLWCRHIADSLLFNIGLKKASPSCVDLGSGVGLPGLPLAIARPDARFELVDRSGRRCDLLRRAIAVLGLENCLVIHRDLSAVDKEFDSVVSRAALPPEQLMIHVKRLLAADGMAILGLTRLNKTQDSLTVPRELRASVVSVPTDILDTTVKLLRIVTA